MVIIKSPNTVGAGRFEPICGLEFPHDSYISTRGHTTATQESRFEARTSRTP